MKPRFKRLGTKTHFMTGRLMFPKLGETCQHRFHPFKTHLQKCGASGGGPPSLEERGLHPAMEQSLLADLLAS